MMNLGEEQFSLIRAARRKGKFLSAIMTRPNTIPGFVLVAEGPEQDFLECRLNLPREQAFATEIERKQKLTPGDIKVVYSREDGRIENVQVYRRANTKEE